MLVLSWLGAIVACFGYGVASVLAVGRREARRRSRRADRAGPDHQAGAVSAGIWRWTRCRFAGNVVALQRLPLFLVQSIVAGSVGVTAVIASLRGARLS